MNYGDYKNINDYDIGSVAILKSLKGHYVTLKVLTKDGYDIVYGTLSSVNEQSSYSLNNDTEELFITAFLEDINIDKYDKGGNEIDDYSPYYYSDLEIDVKYITELILK